MITVTDRIDLGNNEYINLDARYTDPNGNPFSSVSAAQTYHAKKMNELFIGFTVLVKESGWTYAKEYWVQPKGTTPETYGLVEKGAGTTDYNDLDNKPTIGDGTNTALPIVGNVKVSASTASGNTAGVSVTQGQTAGEIEMNFTLPKGADGANGQNGITPSINPTTKHWMIGNTDTAVVAEGQNGAPGADAVNPFKGWYKTGDTLPTTGASGDYLYFKDTTETPAVTTIYSWDGTEFVDTETEVDESNVQTFETGQQVNGVGIDNTGLKNAVREGVVLPQAGDVQLMKQQLKGVTLEETKASTGTLYNGVLNANTKEFVGTQGAARYCVIPLNGATKVRFNGVSYGDANTSYYYGFGFYDSEDNIIGTQAYEGRGDSGSNTVKEYLADVPEGAVSLICSVILASSVLNESNFYCYLENGSTVLEMMPTVVDNLKTNDASKALSANQGVLLNNKIMELSESFGEVMNIQELVLENKTFIAELTIAYLASNGTIYQYGNNETLSNNVFKNVASIYFIEVGDLTSDRKIKFTPMEEINEGETYKVYFFDVNFTELGSSVLGSDSGYVATIPLGTKYLRLSVSSETDLNYSVRYVEVSAKTNVLRKCGVRNFLTTSDYITQDGILKYYRTIFEVSYKGQRFYNLGWFFYSPFYKPTGKKSKLVILYNGSGTYKYNKGWSSFSQNYQSQVFSLVHSGYCVALCSCLTSLYGPNSASNAISDCSGDQLSINAYQSYYEYLIKNFNVEENPYIISYSNGGMPAGRINILGDIPAKAIAGGAIVTDLIGLFRILGYAVNINKIMHNCGVPDDVVVSHGGSEFTEEDFNVIKEQGDILKNYSPMFMSCKGLDWDTYIDTMKDVSFVNMETNQGMVNLMANVEIQSEIPIKIWISRDDETVSYGIEKFYIEAVNRGGGRAFLRTMPDNTGKHAMGNYGNADSIKVTNYTFKDGTVADTTLFMSEVIDWFEQWK
ncbi:MAG: hypothetical protein SPM02_03055 [Bacteroidales bacterium]|nr:hypothetical protein [Bacteroidales bacterium]